MSEPYIGEVKMFGGNFAPLSYAFCDGSIIPISQNDTLFALIGTIYGGDGQTTFALPDLRGRIPLHQGNGFVIGQVAGTETVTLNNQQLAAHSHQVAVSSNAGSSVSPQNNIIAGTGSFNTYNAATADNQMGGQMIGGAGSSQPHNNMMPYLCITFIICLEGIFPPRN